MFLSVRKYSFDEAELNKDACGSRLVGHSFRVVYEISIAGIALSDAIPIFCVDLRRGHDLCFKMSCL